MSAEIVISEGKYQILITNRITGATWTIPCEDRADMEAKRDIVRQGCDATLKLIRRYYA